MGDKDGKIISVLELCTDEESASRPLEFTLVAICKRGFLKKGHFKTMVFSPDNELLLISSETAKIKVFYIGEYLRAKHNLVHVRKNELRSCISFKVSDLILESRLFAGIVGKATLK